MGLTVAALFLVAGCGKDDESLAKKAGAKVGETLTEFASGVGKGIDKEMAVTVELSQALADAGMTKTIAKAGGLDHPNTKTILVYLVAQKPFNSLLIAKALNKEGQELGRSIVRRPA